MENENTPKQVHQQIELRQRIPHRIAQSPLRVDSPKATVLPDHPQKPHEDRSDRGRQLVLEKSAPLETKQRHQKFRSNKDADRERAHEFQQGDIGEFVRYQEQTEYGTRQKRTPIFPKTPLGRGQQLESEEQKDYRRNGKIKQRRFRENQHTAQERRKDTHAHRTHTGPRQVLDLHGPETECAPDHPKEPAKETYGQDAKSTRHQGDDELPHDHAQRDTGEVRPRRKSRPRLERDHIRTKRKDGKNDADVTISQCRTPQKSFVKRLRTKFHPLCSGAPDEPAASRTQSIPPPDSYE